MNTTRLSSKGQVIIPKAVRNLHNWETGLELVVVDTEGGIMLKPKTPFPETKLANVAGILKSKVQAKTDTEIQAALKAAARRKWRDSN